MRNTELSEIQPQNSSQGTLRCFAHPSIILGVIAGTAILLSAGIWITQQTLAAEHIRKVGILEVAGFGGIVTASLFIFMALERLATKIGSANLYGFCYGLFYPTFQLASLTGFPTLKAASFEGFGTVMRSCNRFTEASICYEQAAKSTKRFSNQRLDFEREYAMSLFYAGQEEQATIFAENNYKYWLGITNEVIREEAIERLGQSAYTAAAILYQTGHKSKASQILGEFYEKAKKCTVKSKARLFALLCEGERLTKEKQFTDAIVPLTEFCEAASGHRTFPPGLRASGYSNLAICLARIGKREAALEQKELAVKQLRDDLGIDSRLAEVALEADILIALEETSKAEEILSKDSEKSVLAQTIVPLKSDTQFPPPNFRSHCGIILDMNTLAINSLFSGIVAAIFFHSADFAIKLAILVPAFVVANIVVRIISNQKGSKARIALSKATRRDVIVQLKGTAVELREPEKFKPIGKYYINWALQEETQEIVGTSSFKATAFEHEGSLIAIEIFGQYGNLSKSGFFP